MDESSSFRGLASSSPSGHGKIIRNSRPVIPMLMVIRYAFTPLLSLTIKKNLNLTTEQIANTNIAALTGTLLVRFVAGPLCDRFGPRKTYILILLAGSIPTAMAGLVTNWRGLLALRFFVGILGGTFVPCQVWSTGFFDKNVVGTSNALIGGWGNSGGGITYFLMPVIYDSKCLFLCRRETTPLTCSRSGS